MPPTEEDIGVEALDGSIDKLNRKVETLERLKDILEDTPEDASLHVEDARDSYVIHVIIRCKRMVDVMVKLAWMDFTLQGEKSHPDNIEYDIEKEEYKLEKKFRIDR